ncbi:hypothetical protein C0993_006487 [Termitomyces sp. T159_Od127]|nr:hypothetical protein C0993_006487 [Termitomyces sp. T159_Od127]
MVSLRSPQTLQPSITPAPLLRKRHSTYVLPTPPDPAKTPVPLPDPSPIRPLCNSAFGDITTPVPPTEKKNGVKGLPTLRTSTTRDWDFHSETRNDKLLQASPVASDSSSPISARLRQSLATGPVSEVAPWEMYPVRRSATSHTSLTSGSVEEVTPWELHPVPTVMPNRSTLATGPLEDVTPWELGPAPPSTISEKQFSTRGSSSNQGKSPSEATHSRRRKSTSARAVKPRFTFFGSSSTGQPGGSRNLPSEGLEPSTKSVPKPLHTTSPRARLPPLSPLLMINGHDTRIESQQNFDFLTADRTIFGEPKRYCGARDAQFVIKGQGTSLGSPLTRHGKKHHAFPPERVPYPRSYEQEVVDL